MKKSEVSPTFDGMGKAADFFEAFLIEAEAPMKAIIRVIAVVDEVHSFGGGARSASLW